MSDSEYSVVTSDVIKSFDCICNAVDPDHTAPHGNSLHERKYSKTSVKRPLKNRQNKGLNVKMVA